MNPNIENTSSAKRRKLKSKVWAKCKNGKKDFVGSSKSRTTHLRNHLTSCRGLKNPGGVVVKEKETSVIDLESNGFDLVLKIIKYGLNNTKNDILDVYKQEKDKLHRYLHNIPSRFNVTIESTIESEIDSWFLTIRFINDSWELKNIITFLGRCKDEDDVYQIGKSWLVDWNIDKKICSMPRVLPEWEEVIENINNWLNERGSLPLIGNLGSIDSLLSKFFYNISLYTLERISRNDISTKAVKLRDYVKMSSNIIKFQYAVKKALSMGKTVTSKSVPSSQEFDRNILEWVMGCKDAFCELEHIDPNFKSINFIKEDWDEATLLYNSWKALEDLRVEAWNFLPENETANVYFPMVCHIFLKLVQLGKSENHYYCHVASCFRKDFDECCNNSTLGLIITVILDPRFKTDIVEHFYKEIYGNDANAYLKKILDDVTNVYNKYAEGPDNFKSSSTSNHGDSNSSQHINNIATPISELDRYLGDFKCLSTEVFVILEWWRVNSPTYPILAKIARDFLSLPLCNQRDLYESFFGEIEDIYDYTNLDDDLKLPLACTKVWLNSPVIK